MKCNDHDFQDLNKCMYICFYITKVYRKSNRREEKRNSKGARWIIPRQPAARLRSENIEK